ncbi:unnamed protein product [Ilex paraguariensis]|uniref:Ycf2 N-terminal domain-containing protein n=1 Tax=Ilex paraguariensis TaxID=185542 RepID=A0ABC8TW37_9AQUA
MDESYNGSISEAGGLLQGTGSLSDTRQSRIKSRSPPDQAGYEGRCLKVSVHRQEEVQRKDSTNRPKQSNPLVPPLRVKGSRFGCFIIPLGDSLEEIRGSASGGNMLLGGGPAYGVKSIRSKKKYLNINLSLYSGKDQVTSLAWS